MIYAHRVAGTIRMPTQDELVRVLKESGKYAEHYRDHMLIALPAGMGLRPKEVRLLNCGDVFDYEETSPAHVRSRFRLREGCYKKCSKKPADQLVLVPRQIRRKLMAFAKWKQHRKQSVAPDAPLFKSRQNARISGRRIREIYQTWSERCGFRENVLGHGLRHRYCTDLYRETQDLHLVAKAARHKYTQTTEIYIHPTVDDIVPVVDRIWY